MMYTTSDVWSQLRPRNVDRKQRRPGIRERNSFLRQRFHEPAVQSQTSPTKARTTEGQYRPSYSMQSAVTDFGKLSSTSQKETVNEEHITSQYKELSTLDAIRNSMEMTARVKSAPPEHVPKWMVGLDINLDISSCDVIPPYDDNSDVILKTSDTFSERASFIFLDNESDDEVIEETQGPKLIETNEELIYPETNTDNLTTCDSRTNNTNVSHIKTNTFKVAGRFSPTQSQKYGKEGESPRRYQGDKKVMSLQQGGIRSTPFQPKSKKFINQMITFNHMKHHDRKLRIAKPAVDTKMPSTFKIAIDRKRVVEQRLTDSWLREIETSTPNRSVCSEPSNTANSSTDKSKHR